MNKLTKILSVVLVLVLALSVMVLPTSAATPTVKADVVAEHQGTNTNGLEVYKFSVYLESTLSLCAYQLNITYDNAVWQLLRATNTNTNQAAVIANMVIDKNDTNNIMYQASDAYANYGGGNWDYGTDNGYVLMPGDGTNPTLAKISNTNMGTELTEAGYTGLYSTWANDFTDNYLCISGGSLNGHNSPTSGRVMVMSWYMGIKEGTAPGNYEVGFNAKQLYRLTGTYNTEDACGSLDVGVNKASITQDMVTYTNAIVTVEEEKSPVYNLTSQIRFNGPVDGDYAPFDVRTRAAMSVDDFNALCTYEASTKATNIEKVGFVYADSSVGLTLDNAAKVIGGTAVAGYVDVPVEHIQKTATEYVWTCLITDAAYADAVDSVGYIVVDGETYYFDAVYATDFSALYDTWSSKIPTA